MTAVSDSRPAAPPATPLLEVSELTAGYAGREVVVQTSLEVRAGEVVVLLGPNGAGKTTLLEAISGRIAAMNGSVRIGGAPAARRYHLRVRSGLAYIPERRSVFGSLTVAENLRVGGAKMDAALELFPELTDHLSRKAGVLSGGQQQMLTLARAVASSPSVILADEVSLGLSPVAVDRLHRAFQEIATSRQIGVLLVEQHVRKALEIADRGYVMSRGQIVMSGPAQAIGSEAGRLERAYLGETR
jgi:ABC-type branched-subunit amino acid transport system ATPase component